MNKQPSGGRRPTEPRRAPPQSIPHTPPRAGRAGDGPAEPKPKTKAPAKSRKPDPARPPEQSASTFGNLPLSAVTLGALAEAGYLEPTAIQAGFIPRALAGVDVMGQARTGTGKTAAFAIPILERLQPQRGAGPRALVLVPTRELAVQVRDEVAKLAYGRKAHIVAAYGGKPIRKQSEQLRAGADIVVGTPGRILDHLDRRTLVLDDVEVLVLDEADRMLDIGFRPDIERILRRSPRDRQTLLLSATIPPPVMRLARQYMREPEMLDFSPTDITVDTIEQFYFTVDPERKFELLLALLQREQPRQAIVFCRTRRGTEKVYQRLAKRITGVAAIHGDLAQPVRDRVMAGFREGSVRYLVATDVVGRGIDVSNISHIINFDIPQFCDDYVHRVGRTGRMGREGVAFSFVTPEEGPELTRIEMRINKLLIRDELAGFESLRPAVRGILETGSGVEAAAPDGNPAVPERKPVFGRAGRRYRRAL